MTGLLTAVGSSLAFAAPPQISWLGCCSLCASSSMWIVMVTSSSFSCSLRSIFMQRLLFALRDGGSGRDSSCLGVLRSRWRAKLSVIPFLTVLIASSGGSLPLGSCGARPSCVDEFSSSNHGIWVSSETSSADLAVCGLARGYLSGLGEHGGR